MQEQTQITLVCLRTLGQRGIFTSKQEESPLSAPLWYVEAEDDCRSCMRDGEGSTEGEARHNAMKNLRVYLVWRKERDKRLLREKAEDGN